MITSESPAIMEILIYFSELYDGETICCSRRRENDEIFNPPATYTGNTFYENRYTIRLLLL